MPAEPVLTAATARARAYFEEFAGSYDEAARDSGWLLNGRLVDALAGDPTVYPVPAPIERVRTGLAWTVVVAKALQLTGSPNLVINANYASSTVPVPAGAGNNYHSGQVTLSK